MIFLCMRFADLVLLITFLDWDYAFPNKTRKVVHMKEDIIKFGTREVGKELCKNASIHFSLEGWPCAVAFIGLGFAYVMTIKIKCDAQTKPLTNTDAKRVEKVA